MSPDHGVPYTPVLPPSGVPAWAGNDGWLEQPTRGRSRSLVTQQHSKRRRPGMNPLAPPDFAPRARRCMIARGTTLVPDARSVADRLRSRLPRIELPVQHLDRESELAVLCCAVSASEPAADELPVPVEGALDSCLLMVADLLLPCPSTEFARRLDPRVSLACSARQRAVIGYGSVIETRQAQQRSGEASGLSRRQGEHGARRERGLDRETRAEPLSASCSRSSGGPSGDRLFAEPDRHVALERVALVRTHAGYEHGTPSCCPAGSDSTARLTCTQSPRSDRKAAMVRHFRPYRSMHQGRFLAAHIRFTMAFSEGSDERSGHRDSRGLVNTERGWFQRVRIL